MMGKAWLAIGVAGALGGALLAGFAIAQETPESLLPPGFDDPEPTPTDAPAPAALPTAAPVAPPVPAAAPPLSPDEDAAGPIELPPVSELSDEELRNLPSLEELEALSSDELDDLFGLKPKYDIPPAARRSLAKVGLLARDEGGFVAGSLAKQPAQLVRAILEGNQTPLVSRWGHILVRRALASRLAAPEGMNAVEFAALRTGALNRMGEYVLARGMVQDIDTANWSKALAREAKTAYIAQADPLGMCPYVRLQGPLETEVDNAAQWTMLSAICDAYAGESAFANSQLDRALNEEIAPAIDVLLARRFAGAAGAGQRAVSVEWDEVEELTPWRFSLANAVGEPVPEPLLDQAAPFYARAGAASPMTPLQRRAQYAATAGKEGIFSAQALVDLYSEIYTDDAVNGDARERARILRSAYLAGAPADRIDAMVSLWQGASGIASEPGGYWAKVLTAYAAARIAPGAANAGEADQLITSMLAAGLERDAAAWKPFVDEGSLAWALIVLTDPDGGEAGLSGLDTFVDDYSGSDTAKAPFLIASLAGLGRISASDREAFEERLALGLGRQTKWVRMISKAAEVRNPALVALLAGLGMQGDSWSQMTPLHLYHITAALMAVGLEAEARMIAAEALARA